MATSFLRHLSEPARASLMERAQLVYRPPNQIIIDGHGGFAGVVVSGLLRAYEDSDAGPITVRNVGIGEAVGIASLLGDDDDVWVQAVSASHILRFDLSVVSDLRQRDANFNLAVGKEAFRRLRDTTAELLLRVHGSIRQNREATARPRGRQWRRRPCRGRGDARGYCRRNRLTAGGREQGARRDEQGWSDRPCAKPNHHLRSAEAACVCARPLIRRRARPGRPWPRGARGRRTRAPRARRRAR